MCRAIGEVQKLLLAGLGSVYLDQVDGRLVIGVLDRDGQPIYSAEWKPTSRRETFDEAVTEVMLRATDQVETWRAERDAARRR